MSDHSMTAPRVVAWVMPDDLARLATCGGDRVFLTTGPVDGAVPLIVGTAPATPEAGDLVSRAAAIKATVHLLRDGVISGDAEGYVSAALKALPAAAQGQEGAVGFQSRVQPWMMTCFGAEISADRLERADRLLEEVFELLQSGDYPRDRVAALAGYVWSRPRVSPPKRLGGMVTLAAYCLAHDLDMHDAGETELARVWTKVEKIRAKQAAKPVGSALPQAWPVIPTPSLAVPPPHWADGEGGDA